MTEYQYQQILQLVDEYDTISCECAILFDEDGYINSESNDQMKVAHKKLRDYLRQFVKE